MRVDSLIVFERRVPSWPSQISCNQRVALQESFALSKFYTRFYTHFYTRFYSLWGIAFSRIFDYSDS